MKVSLNIKKVTVFLTRSTDIICLDLDAETPFPELKYEASAKIDARAGYGQTWCEKVLGIKPEVINTK